MGVCLAGRTKRLLWRPTGQGARESLCSQKFDTRLIYLKRMLAVGNVERGHICGSAWKRDPVSGVIGVE